jgi:flagellar basal-body rod modification protein FlgD
METSALAALTSASQTETSRKGIADNFDAFLSLLTTQLKNQNPLDPLDSNEFTAQLVQFSGVEQSIKTNENLEKLLALSSASTLTTAVGFIGKVVTASGDTTSLVNGQAQWSYTVDQDVPEATITIKDKFGQTVFTNQTNLLSGTQTLQWDGRTTSGAQSPPGSYTISIDAKDSSSNPLKVDTTIIGLVESVDMTGSEPELTISGSKIKFSAVKTVSNTP